MPLKLPHGGVEGLDIIQFNIRPPAGPVVKYPVRKKDGVSDNNSVKKRLTSLPVCEDMGR